MPRRHHTFTNIHVFSGIRTQSQRHSSQRRQPLYQMGDKSTFQTEGCQADNKLTAKPLKIWQVSKMIWLIFTRTPKHQQPLSCYTGIVVSDTDNYAVGPRFESGEGMDIRQYKGPLRHENTLNSRRAASPLMRLVEEEERWEAPDHLQGVLP
ncbi:hypothetical protein TNCV_3259551 [Trichonephila clavipes]|nr:hypothetical protein TNCV_3259551 [Trichonephila clavipes]